MRLTLRTLLAYRDQVLASKDALDLQEKIDAEEDSVDTVENELQDEAVEPEVQVQEASEHVIKLQL